MAARVVIDEGRCCGAGNCASVAPDVFDQAVETGLVVLLQAEPSPTLLPLVEEAAELCPVSAISLVGS